MRTGLKVSPRLYSLFEDMGEEFIRLAGENPHLARYVYEWNGKEGSQLGPPGFALVLTREMGYLKAFNRIYSVGGSTFIHVHKREIEAYGTYNPIEPRLPRDKRKLVEDVEDLIASAVDESIQVKDRAEVFDSLFKQVVRVGSGEGGARRRRTLPGRNSLLDVYGVLFDLFRGVFRARNPISPDASEEGIMVDPETYELLRFDFFREHVGFGDLEPFLKDPYLEDISCDGVGPIFVFHKVFGPLKSTIAFESHEELNTFVIKLCERVRKPLSSKNPIVDTVMHDGSRLNVVYGTELSRRGSNFTLRKFPEVPMSVTELIEVGTFSAQAAAYLWILLDCDMSVFFCGETASGKTTTLNAVSVFIKPANKVVSIEETPEVVLPHPNWINEVAKQAGAYKIDLYDLLKNSLRQRPEYIIVGEIRGREGHVAFQAMQTGHPCLSTFHSSSVEKLIQRLTGEPIEVPPAYLNNLNAVVFQRIIIDKEGNLKRRVTSINEIVGFEPSEKTHNYIEVFSWDPAKDVNIFRGVGSSYLLEQEVAPRRGLPVQKWKLVYEELNLRTLILERMVRLGVLNYYDVYKVISEMSNIPLKDAAREIDGICEKVISPA